MSDITYVTMNILKWEFFSKTLLDHSVYFRYIRFMQRYFRVKGNNRAQHQKYRGSQNYSYYIYLHD